MFQIAEKLCYWLNISHIRRWEELLVGLNQELSGALSIFICLGFQSSLVGLVSLTPGMKSSIYIVDFYSFDGLI